VHVKSNLIYQFTYGLNDTLKKKEKVFQEAIQGNNKDFEYGTLPSLMKLKALQEKESMAAQENRQKKMNITSERDGSETLPDEEVEEKQESAKQINELIIERSKEASLVITNLPPILKGQSSHEYLKFCTLMTEGIQRLLFIQNSSKEVLT
jgi:spore germination cell wall hydrolase CwlJ-like protein